MADKQSIFTFGLVENILLLLLLIFLHTSLYVSLYLWAVFEKVYWNVFFAICIEHGHISASNSLFM